MSMDQIAGIKIHQRSIINEQMESDKPAQASIFIKVHIINRKDYNIFLFFKRV